MCAVIHPAAGRRPFQHFVSTISVLRQKVNPTNGSHSFHISNDAHIDGVVQTIEAIGAFARDHGPGRYVVNEHYPNPLHDSFNSSKVWGEVIHHLDGKIAIRIAPTPDPR